MTQALTGSTGCDTENVMADVNIQLVREFFELNLFAVLTNWQRDTLRLRGADSGLQLFVENVNPALPRALDFVLSPVDLCSIERALVEVRAWHAERFYPSVVDSSPVLAQFVSEDSLSFAREIFGSRPFTTILVISELPASSEPRARSIDLLESAGIGHIIEFPSILRDLLEKVSMHENYTPSPTLQILRLLKRYKLVRNQQLEFAFLNEAPVAETPPPLEVVTEPDVDADEDDEQ